MRTNLAWRSLLGSLLLTAAIVQDAPAVAIDSGFTGAWYDPAQSGHGLFVEVLNNNGFLAWWFTFDPAGGKQSWFGGVGTYSGNTATITQVIQTTGGRWIPNFDPAKLVQIPWGTLTFTFTDCNNGRVDFNSTAPGYSVGSMTLSRLTLPDGLTCSDSGGTSAAEGLWSGTTSADETALGIVLSDGTYYVLYSAPGIPATESGVFQGTANTANGQFVSTDAMDFPIAHDTETFQLAKAATVGGTYVSGTTLQLSLSGRASPRTLTAAYVAGSNQPPSLAALAGSYTGFTGHASGERSANFTLDASGNLSGNNAAQCSYAGTVTPRASVKAFDFTLRSVGIAGNCIFGLGPISGILYYDEASRRIHAFTPYAGRSDQYYVIGTKQ